METKNLDKLIDQAANADRRSYEGARIRTRFARLFATHGPALVAALKRSIHMGHNGSCEFYDGKDCGCGLDRDLALLLKLDQEATCQK